VTDALGRLACSGRPDVQGDVVLEATVTDPQGHAAVANADVWVARGEEMWFEAGDSDRIDVLPERRRYQPGETARFQVRMPFREAAALVTIDREGVGDAPVQPGAEPVIELPVDALGPNAFVPACGARAHRRRAPCAGDLGRPSFRLGIAEIEVDEAAQAGRVGDDRPSDLSRGAGDRDHLGADTRRRPAAPEARWRRGGGRGLLELSPNGSWRPRRHDGTARRRGAHRDGADGGSASGRIAESVPGEEVAVGNPRAAPIPCCLAAPGRPRRSRRRRVTVPLNDSLTSFRVEAVATAGLAQFGAGGTALSTTQDLMLLPGLPPLVREGDRFHADLTVRNTTARAMTVEARGIVAGLRAPLAPQTLSLGAGEAVVTGWDVAVPAGVTSLGWDVEVGERGGATDHVRVTQQVLPAVPVRTLQATLFQWSPDAAPVPVTPQDALPDRGGVIAVTPSLAGGRRRATGCGAIYSCLEQRVSRRRVGDDEA
jgi:hypothetical protein